MDDTVSLFVAMLTVMPAYLAPMAGLPCTMVNIPSFTHLQRIISTIEVIGNANGFIGGSRGVMAAASAA